MPVSIKGGESPPRGGVAQLGEHLPCKQGVMSSNLTISIKIKNERKVCCLSEVFLKET